MISTQTALEGSAFRRSVLRSLMWLGTGTWVGQLISWVSTVVVIRLLSPSDFGLMAMTTIFTGLLSTIGELGIGAAVVQAKDLTERQVRQIGGWVVLTGTAGLVLAYVSAPAVAAFYEQERLVPLIRVMAFSILLMMLYVIPQSLYQRELNFKARATIEVTSQFISTVVTLAFVWAGTGVWSLVAGLLALHATKAVGFNVARGWIAPLFDLRDSVGLLKYGATVTSDRVLSFMYQQSDKIIVGRMLGDMLLGTYNIAQTLGMIPLEKVLPIITQVSFASYARIQGDLDRVRRNLLRSTRAVALVAFPLFFGMSAVAPLGIPLILGAKWQSAIVPFQLLCLGMPFRALGPLLGAVLHGIGRPDLSLRNMASLTVALTIAFLVAAPFGLIPVCVTWLTVYPVVLMVTIWLSLRHIELPLPEYLAEIWFPLLGSAAMLGTLKLLERTLATSRPALTLVVTIAFGVAIYGSLVFIFKRREFQDIRGLIGR